jgi:hypothetical protein
MKLITPKKTIKSVTCFSPIPSGRIDLKWEELDNTIKVKLISREVK